MRNPLLELRKYGQSVWYDNIRRGLITSGEFQRMVAGDGVVGVTSNPTIFEKAIDGSTDYDADIKELVAQGKDVPDIYNALVIKDIQLAAVILRPAYDETRSRDGYACLEVPPDLAYDTEASINAARFLWKALDRPNVMIKIPGTAQGLPAIEQCLSEGININITLLFGVENYEQVALAYINALEKRVQRGEPVDRMASVASFFVSRVDTLVDKQLDEKIRAARDAEEKRRLEGLLGRAGIANAKIAYQRFQEIFAGDRWRALADRGARFQRCLWASTSTKNPQYRDVMYVEGLLGPDTVNTMPQATLDAFREHGEIVATITENPGEAHALIDELTAAGIDFKAVTDELQRQGVDLFADSYHKLLESIKAKREKLLAEEKRYTASLGGLGPKVDETLRRLEEDDFPRRLWAKDPSLWKGDAEAIKNRLGWLTVTEKMAEHADQLQAFGGEIRAAGFNRVVLIGMGGASLSAEVSQRTFGAAPGYPDLVLLDTTDPAAVRALEESLDLERTLFIVASKSGTTIETLVLYRYFREKLRALKGDGFGENFVAITDAGTPLDRLAREEGFRRRFLNPADVGGRFSALSYFGLVPAAVIGVDVARLLDRTETLVQGCASCVPPWENPGIWLGAALGTLALAGRDKVTIIASPPVEGFGAWAEQMLAESTGKDGKGLVPVSGEPLGDPQAYGDDRLFVYLQTDGAGPFDDKVRTLEDAGQPVVRLRLEDAYDLGQEFFRWEIATAVAGSILGINPFDEPNVQESKDNSGRLLEEHARRGRLSEPEPDAEVDGFRLYGGRGESLAEALRAHLRGAKPGDYVGLMAFLPPSPEHDGALEEMRLRIRDALKVATSVGYGPRYLHSTGQLFKGGPDTGVFLQLTADDAEDLPIPGERYGFSVLKQAQALGDFRSMRGRGRRIMRVHLAGDTTAGLRKLSAALEEALS
ncbi:MAG: bifunctional transaldolase/phosoglucose isomerase [Chloroflexi bacterium]|nr:bifunctional transaldolase/phosoglucose isomerase [Chloroflexota bacterium]